MALSRGSKWFLTFSMLGIAGLMAALWWVDQNVFVDDLVAGEPVEYTVTRGQSVRAVGDELAELRVVRSSVRFRLAADEAGLAEVLQPGRFELETGMEIDDAIAVLAAGPLAPPSIRFTVPEGLTVEQTLERLADQFVAFSVDDFRAVLDERVDVGENRVDVLRIPEWVPEPADAAALIEPFEGLLFPETYDVPDDATAQQILQRMVDQLTTELGRIPEQLLIDAEEERGLSTYEVLTLASLIERETRVDDERSVIAGVITNRLDEGMRLQIDATVVYAIGAGPTAIVTFDDLEVEHPHNTYRIDGLPPTPIAGVGAASLRAAFEPEEVPYRFYVLDAACDGRHVFAETGEEHQVNVDAFRDAGRCQPGS